MNEVRHSANNTNDRLTLKDVTLIMAVSGVTTLNVFLSGTLTVALPTIGRDLNFKQADFQWPVNVYALSFGCSVLFFGRLGDIVGGRVMFLSGSLWFALWSLVSAFAPNDKAFIVFMALKGLGAAANTPSGVGLFSSYFPLGVKRNTAFGVLGAGQPIGFILGLIIGGILTESKATWRSLFYIQTGLAVAFTVAGWFVLHKQPETRRYTKGLDYGGTLLSALGIGLLTYSLADSTTAQKGWSTPQIPSLFSASFVILAAFIYYERRREAANKSVLMPWSMRSQPGARMPCIIAIVFFTWWSFSTICYFTTLLFQQVQLLSPLQTSLRFIPEAVFGFCVLMITSFLVNRISGQKLIMIGLVGGMAAPLMFALIGLHVSYWAMAFFIVTFGVTGADVVYPVGNLHLTSYFDDDSQSLAGAIFTAATRLGTSLGLAVSSSISTAISSKYIASHPLAELSPNSPEVLMVGFRAAGWTCFSASIVAFTLTVIGLRGIGIIGQKLMVAEKSLDAVELDNKAVVEQAENRLFVPADLSLATSLQTLAIPEANGGATSSQTVVDRKLETVTNSIA